MARGGAALFGFSAVQSASAKAGQFSKLDIFSVVGEPAISSPYQVGGPQPGGKDTTYGFKKSDGPILATGYEVSVKSLTCGTPGKELSFSCIPKPCVVENVPHGTDCSGSEIT